MQETEKPCIPHGPRNRVKVRDEVDGSQAVGRYKNGQADGLRMTGLPTWSTNSRHPCQRREIDGWQGGFGTMNDVVLQRVAKKRHWRRVLIRSVNPQPVGQNGCVDAAEVGCGDQITLAVEIGKRGVLTV